MIDLSKHLGAAVLICCAGAASCENLPGSEWEPTMMNGETFAPAAEVFLRFEQDGRYFGNGGCNTFRGSFVTNGDAILLSPAATTRMMCEETVSRQEFEFLQILMNVRGFRRDSSVLVLSDATGTPVLDLRQRDAD
jgi:heat shock protein HslJ